MEVGGSEGSGVESRVLAVRVTAAGTVVSTLGQCWWGVSSLRIEHEEVSKILLSEWRVDFEELFFRAKLNGPGSSFSARLGTERCAFCHISRSDTGYLIRISEQKLPEFNPEVVLETLPVATLLISQERIIWGNNEASRLVGAADASQLAELPIAKLFPLLKSREEFLANAQSQDVEVTLQDFTGRRRSMRVRARTEGEQSTLIFSSATSALLKNNSPSDSRLAGLGMLVAGVAHEINNPLTFVIPALRDALEVVRGADQRDSRGSELVELLGDALHGVERVAKIASDLREFKRGDEVVTSVDVNQVVVDTIQLAETRLKGKVTLRHALGLPSDVLANSTRLGQVILNLVLNAAQSMPERPANRSVVFVRTWQQEGHVFVSVEDNGKGISESKLGKIFDPFFSTKNAGTGLGLSVCAGIVKRMNGWIEVDSRVGKGSLFTVVLPAQVAETSSTVRFKPVSVAPPPVLSVSEPKSGSKLKVPRVQVLVVDDEPLVIRSMTRMLGKRAEIVQASGGWEAVRYLRDGGEADFVVSDMVMPEGGGEELWNWIKENRPDLRNRFCFMTGMAPSTEREPDLPPAIHKPFSLEDLEEKLIKKIPAPEERADQTGSD